MIRQSVTMRAYPASGHPPHETVGFIPHATSPLAVTHVAVWSEIDKSWHERSNFLITHIPTGYHLDDKEFDTVDEAMAFLIALDPDFPAWPLANGHGKEHDPATMACFQKFRLAEQRTAA